MRRFHVYIVTELQDGAHSNSNYHRDDPTIVISTNESYFYLRQPNAQPSRTELHDERSSQLVVHASGVITIVSTTTTNELLPQYPKQAPVLSPAIGLSSPQPNDF